MSTALSDVASNYAAASANFFLVAFTSRARFGAPADLNAINRSIDLHFPHDVRVFTKFPAIHQLSTDRLEAREMLKDEEEPGVDILKGKDGLESGDVVTLTYIRAIAVVVGFQSAVNGSRCLLVRVSSIFPTSRCCRFVLSIEFGLIRVWLFALVRRG